jgi:hypothetical protein
MAVAVGLVVSMVPTLWQATPQHLPYGVKLIIKAHPPTAKQLADYCAKENAQWSMPQWRDPECITSSASAHPSSSSAR